MATLTWDVQGERYYETGVSKGVLYPFKEGKYSKGVAWNGLTAVNESPSGAEPTPMYADNIKYLNLMSVEELGGTIEAYTAPDEFGACDGTAELTTGVSIGQQPRQTFGLAYQTIIGNDTENNKHGYKIHLVYGALASPTERSYATVNDSPEAMTMSWEFSTTPVSVTGFEPTSLVVIDSTKVDAEKLAAFEAIIYGSEDQEARLPLPNEVATLLGAQAAG